MISVSLDREQLRRLKIEAVRGRSYWDRVSVALAFRLLDTSDPYFDHFYKIGFDGKGLTLLTPENANHQVTRSPDGKHFVDTYSTLDAPPVSVLRDLSGIGRSRSIFPPEPLPDQADGRSPPPNRLSFRIFRSTWCG